MTNTFTKISITIALIAVVFGVLSYSLSTTTFINEVSAQTTCGSCGGGSTGEGTVDEGSEGGGSSTPAPLCNITANITSVNAGGQYTVSWNGTPSNASFKMNGTPVLAQDSVTVTFDGQFDYMRYVLYGMNAGGECSKEVVVYKNVVAPICEISANITSVDIGGRYTVTWNGTPSTGVFKINGNLVADSGSAQFTFAGPNTETYTITGVNGSKTCSKVLTVSKKVVVVPTPICDSFTASPTSIVRGNSSTLTWATTNADSVSINQNINGVAVDGTRAVSPTNTTTYTLTATKGTQSVMCEKTITVTNTPTPNAPICESFTASPITINRGQSSQLTWNTTNANSASINNGVGSVSVDGTYNVSPLLTTTYTLTAIGDENKQVTCSVPVTVVQPDAAITCAANVNFSASPSSIRRGDSSTLTWNTTGLTGVRFDNLNQTNLDGSTTVSPNDSITYTLIGTKGSETINCPVTVSVSASNGGGGGGSPSPRCELKISDKSITVGERVTLTWKTSNATAVSLEDNYNKTLFNTDGKSSSEKKDLYDGEITIRPEKDTTYTLLAERGSKDKKCTVSVDVKDGITVLETRDQQPLVTGIALTQVPYTGFEAGTFMTVTFYTLLALFALYLAYIFGVRPRVSGNLAAVTTTSPYTPAAAVFATPTTTVPNFHAPRTETFSASTAMVGYAAAVASEVTGIEARAHAAGVLVSADALAHIASITDTDNVNEVSDALFALAKESFPSEDGFVTLTNERLTTILS